MSTARYKVLRAYGGLIPGHVIPGGPNALLLVNQGVIERVSDETPLTATDAQEEQDATRSQPRATRGASR